MKTYNIINTDVLKNCLLFLSEMPLGKFYVEIKEARRTLPQNRYYWMILGILAKEQGYTSEELHDALKVKIFGTEKVKDVFGQEYERPVSSKNLSKEDFGKLIDAVFILAGNFNIALPDASHYGLER